MREVDLPKRIFCAAVTLGAVRSPLSAGGTRFRVSTRTAASRSPDQRGAIRDPFPAGQLFCRLRIRKDIALASSAAPLWSRRMVNRGLPSAGLCSTQVLPVGGQS